MGARTRRRRARVGSGRSVKLGDLGGVRVPCSRVEIRVTVWGWIGTGCVVVRVEAGWFVARVKACV